MGVDVKSPMRKPHERRIIVFQQCTIDELLINEVSKAKPVARCESPSSAVPLEMFAKGTIH